MRNTTVIIAVQARTAFGITQRTPGMIVTRDIQSRCSGINFG
jgi:hypothetical protein